jgi:hypothetical protein
MAFKDPKVIPARRARKDLTVRRARLALKVRKAIRALWARKVPRVTREILALKDQPVLKG